MKSTYESEALTKPLDEANVRVSQMVMSDVLESSDSFESPSLSRLEHRGFGKPEAYSVAEFLALPINNWMQLIRSGSLSYLDTNNRLHIADAAMKLLALASEALAVAA